MTFRDGLTGWRRARVVAALIGAVFGFIVVVLSLLPGAPYLPDGVEFIPLVMIFPLFGWAVIERAQEQAARRKGQPKLKWNERGITTNEEANRGWNEMMAQLHKYRIALAVAIPVVILMWILMMISIASSQGQPVHAGNHYYLDDHGSHIPVSKAGYESAISQQQRIFSAGGTAFMIVALGMTLTYDPKKGVSSRTA